MMIRCIGQRFQKSKLWFNYNGLQRLSSSATNLLQDTAGTRNPDDPPRQKGFSPVTASLSEIIKHTIDSEKKRKLQELEQQYHVEDIRTLLPEDYSCGKVMAVLNATRGRQQQLRALGEIYKRREPTEQEIEKKKKRLLLIKKDKTSKHKTKHDNRPEFLNAKVCGVSLQDFEVLLRAARPGEERDAHVILQAMTQYKKIHKLNLTPELSTLAVSQMMAADVKRGGWLVLENMTETSGLYFCATPGSIHDALEHTLENIDHIISQEEKEKDNEENENNDKDESSNDVVVSPKMHVMNTLESLIQALLKRKSRPYRKMKRRPRRRYIKQCFIHWGPNQRTLSLSTQIALAVGVSGEEIRERLIDPCIQEKVRLELSALTDLLEAHEMSTNEKEEQDEIDADEEEGGDSPEGTEIDEEDASADENLGSNEEEDEEVATQEDNEEEEEINEEATEHQDDQTDEKKDTADTVGETTDGDGKAS